MSNEHEQPTLENTSPLLTTSPLLPNENRISQRSSTHTRNRFFLGALFKPSHSTDISSVSGAIQSLLRHAQVKQDPDITQKLKNLQKRQKTLIGL